MEAKGGKEERVKVRKLRREGRRKRGRKLKREGRKCFLIRISAWSASFNFFLSGFPHL